MEPLFEPSATVNLVGMMIPSGLRALRRACSCDEIQTFRIWVAAGLATIGVALQAGCAGEYAPGSPSYEVRDSAGIEIVLSRSPEWGKVGRSIDSLPEVRIGQSEAGPYQFAYVLDAMLLPNGSIAVVEAQANELRIFDRTGSHVKTLGRTGEGPGEFESLASVFPYRGDSLAAFDYGLRRTTVFARSSEGLRTIRNQIEGNYFVFGALGDGSLLLYNPGQYNPDLIPSLQWDSTKVFVTDPDGSATEIATLPVLERLIGSGARRMSLIPAHFSFRAVAEDGFYWATSDRYEIGFYGQDGALRRFLRRDVEPEAVTQDMIDEYVEARLAEVRRFEGEAAVPGYVKSFEEGMYGEKVPLFGAAFADQDGRLWLADSGWPSQQPERQVWSVFSPEGAWLGDLVAPSRVRLIDAQADAVLGIWRDEFDVPYIQLHRINDPAE